jgi:hypothetical protein
VRIGEIEFPAELVNAARSNRLVVFAGAGVSMGPPADLPSFWKLVEHVADGTGLVPTAAETPDRFLGRLAHKEIAVHQRAAARLSKPEARPTDIHKDLLRLFDGPANARIVTTNFDLLFEAAAKETWGEVPEVFRAPALPRGHGFSGIVHVHGALPRDQTLVLTDSDFGRAYLTEGWARRFLVDAFSNYTVLFVGYSHEDMVLQYLARALPGIGLNQRFALDKDSADANRWEILGIHLVPFSMPSKDDYSCLYDGINKLANFCRRDVLEWKREISEAARKPPPVNIEYADLIRHALADSMLTGFFVEACDQIEWVLWLDENRILSPLFEAKKLDERCLAIARWVAERFAIQCANEIFLLLGKYQLRLSPEFWWHLARHIAADKQAELSDPILARWISILLYNIPKDADHFVLQRLAERCSRQGQYLCALQIFQTLIAERLLLREPIVWPDESPEKGPVQPRLQISLGEHWTINEVWTKCLRAHLDVLAEPALMLAVGKLESRHTTYLLWARASDGFDSDSYGRAGIEPHDQDKHPEALDVIIDAARDSIEWIAEHRPKELRNWYDRLIRAPAPLLRRIAIHACRCDRNSAPDLKIAWILSHGLFDLQSRHETFALLKDTYGRSPERTRLTVLDAIDEFSWPDLKDEQRERRAAIEKYQWLHWISEANPDCTLVSEKLARIKEAFPNIEPREHPDLTHWHSDAVWVGPKSPWTVDALLGQEPEEWCKELIAFKEEDPFGPDRQGLAEAVREAARQRPIWGIGLADALAESGHWETDIWDALFRAWSDWSDNFELAQKVMHLTSRPEVQLNHERTIADLLCALVKDGGRIYAPELMAQGNAVARNVWFSASRTNPAQEAHIDWLQSAINDTTGILAEYWVHSLSIAINKGGLPTHQGLVGDYREAFDLMARDDTSAGYFARTILSSQLSFIFSIDEAWTRAQLLPFFTDVSPLRFQHVWHGFLWNRPNHAVIDLLTDAVFAALPRLGVELSSRSDRFVEFYVTTVVWHAKDPLLKWIPQFFQHASLESRGEFALHLGMILRGCEPDAQREIWNKWLSKYWKNRVEGSPVPLVAVEIEHMLNWLPDLEAVFAEAVEIAIRMPLSRLERSHLVYQLKDSALVTTNPDDVARLLSLFLQCTGPQWMLHGVEELVQKLGEQELTEDVRKDLLEKLTMRGIDTSDLDP